MKKFFKDATKRFIGFDRYFEPLRVTNMDKSIRGQFGLPEEGFSNPQEFEDWTIKHLLTDKEKNQKWQEMFVETANKIGLDKKYIPNLEMFISLDYIGGFDIEQPGISKKPIKDKYLRNKALFELSQTIDTDTGKNMNPEKIATVFQPGVDRKSGKLLPTKKLEDYMNRHFNSERKINRWQKAYGITEKKDYPGRAVTKIISRHKIRYGKRLLK